MVFEIIYHIDVVKKDIPKLGNSDRKRIKKAIEEKLLNTPEVFGQPLRKSLKGYRKLRVGDFRVIFSIEKQKIKIFAIMHRAVVYEEITTRK